MVHAGSSGGTRYRMTGRLGKHWYRRAVPEWI
jgi:hypothetical protein